MSDYLRFHQVGTEQYAEINACDAHAAKLARERSAELARATEQFLARGGKIQEVAITARGGGDFNGNAVESLPTSEDTSEFGKYDLQTRNPKSRMNKIMRASVERAFAARQEKARG